MIDCDRSVVNRSVSEKNQSLILRVHAVDVRTHLAVDSLDFIGHDLHDLRSRYLMPGLLLRRATNDVLDHCRLVLGDSLLVGRYIRSPALGLGYGDFHPVASTETVIWAGGSPAKAER